jgi:hypothetical protein
LGHPFAERAAVSTPGAHCCLYRRWDGQVIILLVCVDWGLGRACVRACVRVCVWALPSTVPVSMHHACLCVCVCVVGCAEARDRAYSGSRRALEAHGAYSREIVKCTRKGCNWAGRRQDAAVECKILTREKNNTGAPGATPAGIVTRSAGDVSPAGTAVNRIIVRTAETAHGPGLARCASFRSMRSRSETNRCSRTNQCHRRGTSHAPSSFDQAPGSSSSSARAEPALFPGR